MRIRPASTIIAAAILSCLGLFAANACGSRIDLAAIEKRIVDPTLDRDVRERANMLKTRAAAAIGAGHRDEGRKIYYQLMALLDIPSSSGPYRCN